MDSFWDFFWLMISVFFFFAYLLVMFQILTDLFRDRETNGWIKAIWVLFLLFLPFLTALVYLIARGSGMAERQARAVQAAQADAESYIRSVAGSGGRSPAEEIAQASSLFESGKITRDEFDALKAAALGKAGS